MSSRHRRSLSVLALAGGLLGARAASAGVTIVTQKGTEPPSTIYMDGDHLRVEGGEHSGRHRDVVLIDAAKKTLVTVDDQAKTYTVIDAAERQRIHAQIDGAMAQMRERMKNMPPEQRQKIEEMMARNGMGPGAAKPKERDIKFESMGSKKTINGFSCQMYRKLEEGKVREEMCAVPWSSGLVQKSDFASLSKFAQEMAEDITGRHGSQNLLEELDRYPGIPISRVTIEPDGKRGDEELTKSIKRGSIEASKFAVPAGYTKKELELGPGMHRRP
jgi:hypothetical protein